MEQLQAWARPSRILLATDLTDLDYLLPASIAQAKAYQAELLIVHVLPDAGHSPIDPSQMVYCEPDRMRERARRSLTGAVEAAAAVGVTCSSLLLHGDTVDEIAKTVAQWKVTRLVAGSHGTRKFLLQILGSVAASLFHRVEIPIMAIGPNAGQDHEPVEMRVRVVAGIALDDHSERLARFALNVAEQHQASLSLVRVIPKILRAHPSAVEVLECSKQTLETLLDGKERSISSVDCEVLQGQTVDAIVDYARQAGASLVILGASAHSTFNEHFMPGTAYRVLCEAPCPVLVLKHRGD